MAIRADANTVVQQQLGNSIKKIESQLDCDCLTFVGEIRFGIDDYIREAVEEFRNRRDKLVVVLETPGGYAEVTQRISDTFRKHYRVVDFIVPNYAMSAGTILVMSGDAIHMDDYSILGPIDPQVENRNGQMVPALGYLKRYEDLITKSQNGILTTAELNILIDGFDQAELYKYQQAEKLSEALLVEWLVKYKFKDWSVTETTQTPVTLEMKEARAREISAHLTNSEKWHTHGRGIPMRTLVSEINIKVDDFAKDEPLDKAIRSYYKLLTDYMGQLGLVGALHNRFRFFPLMARQQ